MASSKFTKGLRAKLWTCRIIDWLILLTPIIVYVILAFVNGEVGNTKKIILTGLVAIALIITIFNWFALKHKTSPIWIVIIGLYIAMKNVLLPLVLMVGIGSLLDDFLFKPLINHYKIQLEASKVYDKRENTRNVATIEEK